MEVQAFHQDPVIVGSQKIDEEQHRQLAANLKKKQNNLKQIITFNISFVPYLKLQNKKENITLSPAFHLDLSLSWLYWPLILSINSIVLKRVEQL